MSRFYIRPDNIKENQIRVNGDEAHHILRVMRLEIGDEITAFDGTGREYYGIIEEVSKKGAVIKIEKSSMAKSGKRYTITLAQAVPKMEKMDYIIQKTTELGIDSIIPMNTKRTIVRLNKEKMLSKQRRWKRIAAEASKQCGRVNITEIESYTSLNGVLERGDRYDLALMPSVFSCEKKSLKKILPDFQGRSILLLIGPEGGFDADEHKRASENGVIFVSLGENILRCDTAAIAAVAMLKFSLSDI